MIYKQITVGSDYITNGHHSPLPSITSRLAQAPTTPQSQSSAYTQARTRPSESSASDSDSDLGLNETTHSVAASTSWADLPLLITLVPPVIALFTGGDYLRDILLTCFLVWYLYQLIKGPYASINQIRSSRLIPFLMLHSSVGYLPCVIASPPLAKRTLSFTHT